MADCEIDIIPSLLAKPNKGLGSASECIVIMVGELSDVHPIAGVLGLIHGQISTKPQGCGRVVRSHTVQPQRLLA